VQAGGAIIALFVTIVLSRMDARERKKAAVVQARNAALAMHPTLRVALRDLEWVNLKLIEGKEPDFLEYDVMGDYWIDVGMLRQLHEKLVPHLPWVSSLGSAAEEMQLAFRAIDDLTEDLQSYYHDFLDEGDKVFIGERWPESRAKISTALLRMRTALKAADRLLSI
jgi:hypothetical protein